MADEQFDPSEHGAQEVADAVVEAAEAGDLEEAERIAREEAADKGRVTVMKAAAEAGVDVDPNARYDASGRALNPWESTPKPVQA